MKREAAVNIVVALFATIVLSVLWTPAATAQGIDPIAEYSPGYYSPGERALLPEFCIDTQDGPYGSPEGGEGLNKSPRARHWVAVMGKDFWNMHHYCRALRDTARAARATTTQRYRTFLRLRIESDLKYIVITCAPTMPLMPEVYVRMGDLRVQLHELSAAFEAYQQARKLKPDYWPAYTRWIDVQINLKLFDEAKALALKGLAVMPNQPEIVARLDRIEKARTSAKAAKPTQAPRPNVASESASVPRAR